FMDPASGVTAAFAALCALRRRARTGAGELVEFAQAENLLNYIGEYLIDASVRAEPHDCHGNRHPHRAPQGAYRCRPAGAGTEEPDGTEDSDGAAGDDDRWLALSVPNDEAWAALVAAMGSPAWATDPALATEAGRRAAADTIDEHLSAWVASLDREDAVARCRSAGVAAGPVLDEAGLAADPHLAELGFFRANGSADVDPVEFPGHQWRWDGPPMRWEQLNMMGRDNDLVYRQLLGRTEEELAALDADGHLADGYRDADGRPL
ncbi:MAG: CoA transferase, partial [Actinomycetota bacterium]